MRRLIWPAVCALGFASAALAQPCGPDIRPAIVMNGDARFDPAGGGAAVALGFGAAIGLDTGGQTCLDGQAGRVAPPKALIAGDGRMLRLRDTAIGAPRPRIGFFADRDGLLAFLSRTPGARLVPMLEEAGGGAQAWQVPVITTETVPTALGDITIAEVAVPLSASALTLWSQIDQANAAPLPMVVLDRRGHARRFSEDLFTGLMARLRASGLVAGGLTLVEVGAGGVWTAPRSVTLVDLPGLDPPPADPDPALPHPAPPLGPFPSFDQPTVLLLAGDYDLTAVSGLADRRDVLVLRATPELDWTLRDSAGQLNLAYQDFGLSPDALHQAVVDLPGFAAGSRDAEAQLRERAAAAQAQLGFPEVAPTGPLTLPMAGDWVALRLWVVVTPDLLDLVPL